MFLGCRDSRLFRIDPGSDQATLVTTVEVSPIGIAYGHGSIWWINASEAGGISKIDPENGSITTVTAPYARFVVPSDQHIWFVDANGKAFTVDPGGGRASQAVRKARVAIGVAFDHGTVLINDGDLVAFDAANGDVTQRAHVTGRQSFQAVAGIAVLGSYTWLVDPKGEQIVAVQP
jgi:streptogramin lyase